MTMKTDADILTMPFLLAEFSVVILLIIFPQIVTVPLAWMG
ncbi:hypothetical protein [Edwardsiella tarda]